MSEIKYKRVLLKLSGEALAGEEKRGISADVVEDITRQIKEMVDLGVEVAVVVGGGNFWRGKYGYNMEKTTSDHMGMLATTINALALQDALEAKGVHTRVQTAIEMREIAEPYILRKATKHLGKGRVVIFACGTGNTHFTTDTGAALRAAEVNAEVILVAKTIDGVYSADPKVDPTAVKYDKISYMDVLNKDLKVMDATAISLCRENNIPLVVFAMDNPENMIRAVKGENVGTIVSD
ncbi:MAG: UMP kinase [Clostridia bacterium]|nr:UMP kinase [Clostridia bacterium]